MTMSLTFWGGGFFWGWGIFLVRGNFFVGGGSLTPFFGCENLLVRVKLGHPLNFNFLGKPLLGEKYVEGRKRKKKERISRSPEGCSLTHSARTPPAVHQGITIWVDKIEIEKQKKKNICFGGEIC